MFPQVMGIVNATPDSFYDGNPQNNLDSLLAKCAAHLEDGADILDIGGESTRPGATPVSAEEELARTLELIQQAHARWPKAVISQDTFKIPVALEGLKNGVQIINDVSGTPDPEMFKLVKDFRAQIVIMHTRGTPQTMQTLTQYTDLLGEIKDFLAGKIAQAQQHGLTKEQIIIDPGFGFAKTREQNYHLLAHVAQLKDLGVRMLIGLSHKKFLSQPGEKPPKRKTQTICANLAALQAGADILRVHDVRETKKVVRFFTEWEANK
ncbi:MAG: dihydropteroate synthase [Elusimicrobiaceae bacterium]|nr:dihydropteroate synthase [Elusimicrobiaceae bacterium]